MILWNNEYPKNLGYNNITELKSYIDDLLNCDHYLMLSDAKLITGWAFKFNRNNEKWFAIILSNSIQGKGIGSLLLDKLKENESELCGWMIDHNRDLKNNGKYYSSPLNFYAKNSFNILTDQRLELENLSAVKICWKNE